GRAASGHVAGGRRPVTPLTLEDVWRREATHVLGALVRKYGDFDGCEDACQEAIATAAEEWAAYGTSRQSARMGDPGRVASTRRCPAQRSVAGAAGATGCGPRPGG